MKKTVKWISISLLSLIGLTGIAFLIFLFLLTPARLTPIVNKYCTEYLNAKVSFDSVQVSLFEEFPKVSVKLKGGEIISYALQSDTVLQSGLPVGVDTLMRFNEFMISLNFKDLLKSKINIQRIRITQPYINAYVSPSGRANWEIYTSTDTTAGDNSQPLDLNIDRFSIRGPAILNYRSCPDSMALQASIGRLFLRGKITPNLEQLGIDKFVCSGVTVNGDIEKTGIHTCLVIDSAVVDVLKQRKEYQLNIVGVTSATVGKQNYCDSLPLKLNGTVLLDPANKQFFGVKDFGLAVANLPAIKLNGNVILSNGDITSDMNCKVDAMPLQSLLNLVPEQFSGEAKKIQTNIELSLNTSIVGKYEFNGQGKLPTVDVDFKIPKGQLIYKDLESKIENIVIDASLHYDPVSPANTGIKFKTINVEAFAMTLNGNVAVSNLLNDPNVALNLKGTVNLQEFIKFLPEDLGISGRGDISFNAKGTFLKSRLNQNDMAKNDLIVQFNADKLRLRIPKDTISLLAEKTSLELNTTKTRVNKTTGAVSRLLSFDLKSDTARVRLPGRDIIALSKIDFSMRTSDAVITGDTSKVMPMVGNVAANTMEYTGVDSTTARLLEMKSNFRILPSKENRTLPAIHFDIETKQFSVYAEGNRIGLRDASIVLDATKNDPAQRQQRTTPHQLDSLQNLYPQIQRDSLVAYARALRQSSRLTDDFADQDMDIKDTELGALLRGWTVTGNLKSRTGRAITPYFPLRTRLQDIDLAFTTNDITLQNAIIKCGESKINLTGKIDAIRRALSTGRGLKINAAIKADTLNVNELLTAVYNGSAYSGTSEEYKQALTKTENDDQAEKMIQSENKDKNMSLIVIPSNVSVDITLDAGYGKYADITIDKLTGALVSRDRCLQLKDMHAETSIGDINMTALYATRSKKDVSFGIDLEFKNIQVEKFIDIIPAIDTLIPMLSSFKGIVSSQMAATAAMDSTMGIIMPSLNAACRISGKNMVLMDGETFAEIANKLKFKNRKENLVDSISVEMLIRKNKMEIFPFIMQMDRYKAAIGGVQNLDMTFNYHISVLKSPLPFSIGVNLTGNVDDMDKMKFSIGKPKYKDTNLQAFVTVIDTTRLNLRKQINNIIQQGVDVARFSQFTSPTIDTLLIVNDASAPSLTAQDSLTLYKEGIIDVAPVLATTDSIPRDDKQVKRKRGR